MFTNKQLASAWLKREFRKIKKTSSLESRIIVELWVKSFADYLDRKRDLQSTEKG